MCTPAWKIGMIGTVYFVGWATTLLWLPRFGDIYGRQRVFAIGMTLNLMMYTAMMFTRDLNIMLASVFIQGALTSLMCGVGWIYHMEIVPMHMRTYMGTVTANLDSATYLLATLYFWKVSKDWFYFALIGYIMNVIAAIGAWFLPESPPYLCEKGAVEELEQSLKTIAKFNGRQLKFNP